MALTDIVGAEGDGQDFILEIPVGNSGNVPNDIVTESSGAPLCLEIPEVTNTGGGGNIFIMSE